MFDKVESVHKGIQHSRERDFTRKSLRKDLSRVKCGRKYNK